MAPECCAMGLSSVRVDTGGGGCVQTKMRFFTIFGEESRGMRGEIAGDILPAVKSCRGGTDRDLRFWILDLRRVKYHLFFCEKQSLFRNQWVASEFHPFTG